MLKLEACGPPMFCLFFIVKLTSLTEKQILSLVIIFFNFGAQQMMLAVTCKSGVHIFLLYDSSDPVNVAV